MKKNIAGIILTLCSYVTFSTYAIDITSFTKLLPTIQARAENWVKNAVKPLNFEDQLIILNILAPNDFSSQTQIKFISVIEKNKNMEVPLNHFGKDITEVIHMYITAVDEKAATRNVIDTQDFKEKKAEKINDLIMIVNAIYYKTLHSFMAQTDNKTTKLMYMFDENGIIPTSKRNQKLPIPNEV